MVTTNFLVPTLRYDTLDITGAATTPGSYAFLETGGVASSAIGNFGYSAMGTAELRIHPTDASGTSRADFFDTVRVGASFDYRTSGLGCGFRFKVTRVADTVSPRTFGIETVSVYGSWCLGFVDDPGAAQDVSFVWQVPAGFPSPDGVPALLRDEPVGEGTYRLFQDLPFVIDVPAGSTIVSGGVREHALEGDDPNPITVTVVLYFFESGSRSVLHIDPLQGREGKRVIRSPHAAALFDQIVASIRRVD